MPLKKLKMYSYNLQNRKEKRLKTLRRTNGLDQRTDGQTD